MTLFINCCARKDSRTLKIAHALLDKLGGYEEVNLYEADLTPIDEKRLQKRSELLESGQLDSSEFELARQFASADKIVIAAPFWDFSFPSVLKLYIENIYITGIVSKYSEQGVPVGLCKAQKLYYVTTSGGAFDSRFSYDYISALCRSCFGIKETELIKAEMLDIIGNDADEIVNRAIENIGV